MEKFIATLYVSKDKINFDILETIIKSHSTFWDVDCTYYKSRSFTAGSWEESFKITFFNTSKESLRSVYLSFREYLGINCAVLETEEYFGCIVKSDIIKKCDCIKCSETNNIL